MQNLDQIRAKNALDCSVNCPDDKKMLRDARKQNEEGNCLSGYPALIISNGLLATLAFSIEKGKRHDRIANAIAYHLSVRDIVRQGNPSASGLLKELTNTDDVLRLQRATDEALAFLGFLKRFAGGGA